MSAKDVIIVFDCGATNVRTVAIDINGVVLASESMPNNTQPDPELSGGLIWDVFEIWGKLSATCRSVLEKVNKDRIAGVSVTTFGVDGTFVDDAGNLLYPVISWQCQRSNAVMDNIDKYFSVEELYAQTGVYPHSFNTINKLIWLKENRPDVIEKASNFLFIPSLLVQFLTGEKINDATMMGTSMLTNQKNRKWSDEIFEKLEVSSSLFNPVAESGEVAGKINKQGYEDTGLLAGTPVFLSKAYFCLSGGTNSLITSSNFTSEASSLGNIVRTSKTR